MDAALTGTGTGPPLPVCIVALLLPPPPLPPTTSDQAKNGPSLGDSTALNARFKLKTGDEY